MSVTEPTTTAHVPLPDGSSTPVQIWASDNNDATLVMIWPGFGMGGYYYRPIAAALNKAGFHVAIGELRGQGQSSAQASRSSQWGYHDLASVDFPTQIIAAKTALELPQDHPMRFLSHSMGGQISCLFAARPEARTYNLQSIFGVGAGSPWRPAFSPKMGKRLGLGAVLLGGIGGHVVGYWPGKILGKDMVGYGRQSGTHMREWRKFHKHNSLTDLNGQDIDYVEAMKQVSIPVTFSRCPDDEDCPQASSEALASFIPSAQTKITEIPESLGHNRWAREPESTVKLFLEQEL
ncbi:alpha/beta fold hydrolase [Corynebacterium crudilactis]|uniref:Alpha/beta hydrolase n=1 Tax=Corynebacterium crudilactis TaxID=1652495 RepID=A0A172QQ32_9CORY|nr:alpha/beta fold hydrolase [Corynebacterium crudilactis]ANE02782.1 alpha/beta hydrolase [Corynebacterium crudilactis]